MDRSVFESVALKQVFGTGLRLGSEETDCKKQVPGFSSLLVGMEEERRSPSESSQAMEMKSYIKEFTRHSNDVLLNLNELRHRDILTDATLLVGGTRLRAHCAVLIACSGFFYTLFSRRATMRNVGGEQGFSLALPEALDAGSVSLLLDFMYTSCLPLSPHTVSGVLAAANYLQMEHTSASHPQVELPSGVPLGGRSPPAHPSIFCSPSRPTPETEEPIPDRARVPAASFSSLDRESNRTVTPTMFEGSSPLTSSAPSPDSPSQSSGQPNSPTESSGCSQSPQLKRRTEPNLIPDPKACNWKKYKYIVLNPLCAASIKEEEAARACQQNMDNSSKANNLTVEGSVPNYRKSLISHTPHLGSEQSFQVASEDKGLSPYVCSKTPSHLYPVKFESLPMQLGYIGNRSTNTKPSCSGDKPYHCNVCGAQFNRPANLKTHSRIHSGEKPYRCDTCGARFVQVAHLRAHVLIHTGEKPYPCNTCGTLLFGVKCQLYRSGSLSSHCEKCHLHFRHKSQLRLHLRQKHGAITNTKIRYKVLTDPYQPAASLLQAC
ncbi:hypothetical protein DNTS_014030 [Danionella cerebrum]|uniref:BTB domain-containing protein n=1 Tax=Danionella cerebrum TaxID=2873325 RepID=A0A553MQQ7_9TELE|nr:hypothetical protein DNTS_014030 [Danionella translucida]